MTFVLLTCLDLGLVWPGLRLGFELDNNNGIGKFLPFMFFTPGRGGHLSHDFHS